MVEIILIVAVVVIAAVAVGALVVAVRVASRAAAAPTTPADEVVRTVTAVAEQALGARVEAFARDKAAIDTRLGEMAQLVEAVRRETSTQLGSLDAQLRTTHSHLESLGSTTAQLREILSNNQARGQWGERLADDLLRRAGLVEGVSFERQVTGENGRADYVFLLPGGARLHMDVKFPFAQYAPVLDATTDAARGAAEKAFLADVRKHAKALADRGYHRQADAVEHVLLFVPNEGVFAFIHERAPELFDEALAAGVVFCSPFTLLPVLATVRRAVESHRMAQVSREILDRLDAFRAEWTKYTDKVDAVGKALDQARKHFDELVTTRTRALDRNINAIDALRDGTLEPDAPLGADEPDPALGPRPLEPPADSEAA